MNIRNLRMGELLPIRTDSVFDERPAAEWTWIAEGEGRPLGILMASEAHGTIVILKIHTLPNAPGITMMLLLRAVVREGERRGLRYVVTCLNLQREMEARIGKLLAQVQGTLISNTISGVWMSVPLESIHAK